MVRNPRTTVLLLALALSACVGTVNEAGGGPPRPGEPPDSPPPKIGSEFECAGDRDPGPSLPRRLTVAEYATTIESLFGIGMTADAMEALPPDTRADGFGNTASILLATYDHIAAYDQLATSVAAQIPSVPEWVGQYVACTDLTAGCKEELIQGIGLRILRRPVPAEDQGAFLALLDAAETEGAEFEEASNLLIRSMLQSPRFLYRLEAQLGTGVQKPLDGFEMASRLSFLVWGGPPDEPLYEAAGDDALASDAQIETQVRRMLQDPRARATSLRYVSDWLHLSRLNNLSPGSAAYPDWEPALAADMKAETLAAFDDLIWEQDAPLTDVFNVQRTFATARLARHYGLTVASDAPSEESDWYDVSGVEERGGLLTQGSLLSVGGDSSSMVSRGLYILETVLCGHIEDPPAGVDTTAPTVTAGRSQRSYSDDRIEAAACGGCHLQMEPFAHGIERFDATGQYNLEDPLGNPLMQSSTVVFPGSVGATDFSTSAELMDIVAEHERTSDCINLKSAQFALGRPLVATDGCGLAAIRDEFISGGSTYEALLIAIARSNLTRNVRVDR